MKPIPMNLGIKRLGVLLLSLVWAWALAKPVELKVIGTFDNLVLIGNAQIRFYNNLADKSLFIPEGSLAEGMSLPEGFDLEKKEDGLLIKFAEPYRVSLSADERRLQAVRIGDGNILTPVGVAPVTKKPEAKEDARRPMVFALSHAAPATVAGLLTQLYTGLKVVVDERQRTLMVLVNADDKELIADMVKMLDSPRPQVIFEAEVIEINRTMSQTLGIDYDYLFRLGIKETEIPTPTGPQPFRFGRFGRDTALGISLSATINLLESNGVGQVLARPRVTTLDGLEARINATQNFPIVTTNSSGAQAVQNISTGITLRMVPKVAPDGSVEVQVSISVSSPTGVTSQGAPQYSNREASTVVRVQNGEPIVIGGLLEKRVLEGVEKVPGLSDIPLLGELFKNTTKQNQDTDLVIIITPRLLLTNGK